MKQFAVADTKTFERGREGPPGTAAVRLRVRTPSGHEQVLQMAACDEAEAIRRAAARGFQVLSIEADAARQRRSPGRQAGFPLLLFSQEMLALLEAGLNLTEALAALLAKERQAATHAVLDAVLQALREGRTLSDVLATMPQHFPAVYVATVRASERTGNLPHALARYVAYQIQFDAIRKKLISASIYPVMLLTVGGFVTLFLLGYVVPRFSAVYESSGRDVPWMSQMLLAGGRMIYGHWQMALGGLLTGLGLLGWWLGAAGRRRRLLDRVLRLPWLAAKSDEFRLARLYRAVSLLLAAGISLPRALGMVQGMLSQAQQAALAAARQAVEEGQPLSSALVSAGLATPIAESLVKVGERSGQMAEMLERAARFHDEEFSRWIDWATRLLEPILMTLIGIVIGTVVVLMYMPIFELAGSLQ